MVSALAAEQWIHLNDSEGPTAAIIDSTHTSVRYWSHP